MNNFEIEYPKKVSLEVRILFKKDLLLFMLISTASNYIYNKQLTFYIHCLIVVSELEYISDTSTLQ